MVVRILVCLALLCATSLTPMAGMALAGGPPVCYPPVAQCGPPGPPLPNPAGILGGCLSMCAGICGTIIGIPAAVMGGLLAPPPVGPPSLPKYCGPPAPPYPMYAAAPCGPPPMRISKCKPARHGQYPPAYYGPPAPRGLPLPPPPPLPPLTQDNASFSVARIFDKAPVKMVAGALKSAGDNRKDIDSGTAYASAGTKGSSTPVFGSHW
jgi:hypothetical protein